jgi:hypothetical protein
LQYASKVGNQRLNNACIRALHYQAFSYSTIRNILEGGFENLSAETGIEHHIPEHENQRGKQYYN